MPSSYRPTIVYESDGIRITQEPIGLVIHADRKHLGRDAAQNLHAWLTGHLADQPDRYPREELGH
jgi:hypothetical protein